VRPADGFRWIAPPSWIHQYMSWLLFNCRSSFWGFNSWNISVTARKNSSGEHTLRCFRQGCSISTTCSRWEHAIYWTKTRVNSFFAAFPKNHCSFFSGNGWSSRICVIHGDAEASQEEAWFLGYTTNRGLQNTDTFDGEHTLYWNARCRGGR